MKRVIAAFAFSVLVPLVASGQEVDVTARNKEVIRQNLAHVCAGDVKAFAADFAEDAATSVGPSAARVSSSPWRTSSRRFLTTA
jgi:hypothetical protein